MEARGYPMTDFDAQADLEAGESGSLAGPTAPDTDYHDQQIGR